MKLINMTLHHQGDAEIAMAKEHGYELDPTPRGVLVGPGQQGLEVASGEIAMILSEALRENAGVLIGGHTGALVKGILKMRRLPKMVIFETNRKRDANGRFEFILIGMEVVYE